MHAHREEVEAVRTEQRAVGGSEREALARPRHSQPGDRTVLAADAELNDAEAA